MSHVPWIAVSQRRTWVADAAHDALDRRWAAFFRACGVMGVPMPSSANAEQFLVRLAPDGLLLTGGDDVGVDVERDAAETAAVQWCTALGRPVFGVCRGFQRLVLWSGGLLARVDGHVGRHRVMGAHGEREVASFHRWAIDLLPPSWDVLHRDPDGRPEAACNLSFRWVGVMHHPERERTPHPDDVALVRAHFQQVA